MPGIVGIRMNYSTQIGDLKTWNGAPTNGGKVFPTNPKGVVAGIANGPFARVQASGPLGKLGLAGKLGLGGKQPLQGYGNCSCTAEEFNNCGTPTKGCACSCTKNPETNECEDGTRTITCLS